MRRIAFLGPEQKGGPYFIYKEYVNFLKKNHNDKFQVDFFNTKKDWVKLHFKKYDIVFSCIPFLFKPLGTKKYIYNLHGNFKIERKGSGLGVKLLYLSELNLWFADKIVLVSYFLADKLHFREKYSQKISIIPNFITKIKYKNQGLEENNYKFLTITGFKFYKKAKGILNLARVMKKFAEQNTYQEITWTIVGNENNQIFNAIKSDFDKISFPKNICIIRKGWLNKVDIEKEFLNNNNFIYWSELDNFPGVILEALNYNLKVFINNYESFSYFIPEKFLCSTEGEMLEKISKKSDIHKSFIDEYLFSNITQKLIELLSDLGKTKKI